MILSLSMAMRLRMVGLDVRKHRTAMFIHRDSKNIHIHAVVDRVRDDQRRAVQGRAPGRQSPAAIV